MATYYIDETGQDLAGRTGLSLAQAWVTPSYAATRAILSGDIIHVNAGNYIDNNRCSLSLGVSIEGDSLSRPNITTSYSASTYDGYIYLYSASNTNGNQSISYINIYGNNRVANRGIYVNRRNSVVIHHCNVEDFSTTGIFYQSEDSWNTEPSSYITGCSVYNCSIINCGDRGLGGGVEGAFRATAIHGFSFHDNIITNNEQASGYNGNCMCITFPRESIFYNNTFTKPDDDASAASPRNWNFFVELFHPRGGVEIYDNTFIGAATLDLGGAPGLGALKGTYSYSLSIHDNTFNTASGIQLVTQVAGHNHYAIDVETNLEYVYIYNNYIKNYPTGIGMVTSTLSQVYNQNHVYIYCNKLEDIGYSGYAYTYGIYVNNESNPVSYSGTTDNLHIWNNTIIGGTGYNYQGIICHLRGTFTNSSIKNNIIYDFDNAAVLISRQVDQNPAGSSHTLYLTNVVVNNNDFYSNGTDSVVESGITGKTSCNFTTGNIPDNPSFTSDYRLSSTSSPAWHTGSYVGLISDYADVLWNNPPSMGAYELGSVVLPTVTTTAITSITTITASSGGNVTSAGGGTITGRGVCWSIGEDPTILDSSTSNGTGTGVFTSAITGLTPGVSYVVRAYATNSAGTAYGSSVIFTTLTSGTAPTVTTTAITSITTITASGGGNVTADGGLTVTARGVCWSTSTTPTTVNSYTTDGTGTGVFTSSLTSLLPSTLYYVRAYATNSAGTSYGTQTSFTTSAVVLATLTTTSITFINPTTATGGGNISSAGGGTITDRGVCWSTSTTPTTANSHTHDSTGTGSFASTLIGLIGSTFYYVRAYAVNAAGTAYGSQVTFTTTAVITLPVVTTTVISNNDSPTATGGGDVTSSGGATVTARGVCWSTSTDPTVALSTKTSDGSGTGAFVSSITGLTNGVLYYVRAYATNSVGTAYGNNVTFTSVDVGALISIYNANLCNFYILEYILPEEAYIELTDGITIIRKGNRIGSFVIDIALTPLGFSGVENVDWENIKLIN
jgi:hypothetical protein